MNTRRLAALLVIPFLAGACAGPPASPSPVPSASPPPVPSASPSPVPSASPLPSADPSLALEPLPSLPVGCTLWVQGANVRVYYMTNRDLACGQAATDLGSGWVVSPGTEYQVPVKDHLVCTYGGASWEVKVYDSGIASWGDRACTYFNPDPLTPPPN